MVGPGSWVLWYRRGEERRERPTMVGGGGHGGVLEIVDWGGDKLDGRCYNVAQGGLLLRGVEGCGLPCTAVVGRWGIRRSSLNMRRVLGVGQGPQGDGEGHTQGESGHGALTGEAVALGDEGWGSAVGHDRYDAEA